MEHAASELTDCIPDSDNAAYLLRALALASYAPGFPSEMREAIREAAERFTAWVAGMEAVLRPVQNLLDREEFDGIPIRTGTLRVLD